MDDRTAHLGMPGATRPEGTAGHAPSGVPEGVDSPWVQSQGSGEERRGGGRASASGLLNSVKRQAASQLNAQKDRASDQLDRIANQVRQSTQRLRQDRHDAVAVALERAVDGLERFAAGLRDRDLDDILADLERFGRRRPGLFLGSSFAAGLMLARFAKASNASYSHGRGGGRMSSSFSRPGPADAVGRESQ
jgi:hypothetical protein